VAKQKKDSAESGSDYLTANYILDKATNIVPVSTSLNIHLGGGIPEGSVVIISGAEKLGKTSLALKVGVNGQKLFGKVIVYVNVEHRLKKMNLTGIRGLDISPERFKLVTSQKGEMLSAEQILERAEKALSEFPGCVMILDSLSALSSGNQNTQKYGEGYGMEARKLEAEFFRRIPPAISVNDNIVIAISHVSPAIGSNGVTEKMSKYTQYAQDVKLRIAKPFGPGCPFEWMSGDKRVGHRVKWKVLNSALGSPGGECTGYVRYGVGIDDIAEMIDLACELDIIQKGGAGWCVLPNGEKLQGFEKIYEYLSENEEEYYLIEQKVKEIIS